MDISDNELIRRVISRDERAFDELAAAANKKPSWIYNILWM